jgi:hypothetical protein
VELHSGATGKILGKVYQQAIRLHLEYGSAAWCPASNTRLQELDKVHNQDLRITMGAMKSTPIVEKEKTGKTQSLIDLRDSVRPSGLMLTTVIIFF